MRLHSVAKFFDTLVARDAYSPGTTLRVQFEPMSFAKTDGVMVRKRAVSLAPGVNIPPRGAIEIDGQVYLAGHSAPDYWNGTEIRKLVVIQGADKSVVVKSIAELLLGSVTTSAYADIVFNKIVTDQRESSEATEEYSVFLAGTEGAYRDSVVVHDTDLYLVKYSVISSSGLRIASANKMDDGALETGTRSTRTYNPVTGTFSSTPVALQVLRVRWEDKFKYLSEGQEDYVRGDQTLFVLQADFPATPGDHVQLSDGTWKVISVQGSGTVNVLHVRRA